MRRGGGRPGHDTTWQAFAHKVMHRRLKCSPQKCSGQPHALREAPNYGRSCVPPEFTAADRWPDSGRRSL